MSILEIQVKPNARRQRIEKTEAGLWIAHLQSPPVDGKANQELIELLAKALGIPKSRLQLKAGSRSRRKLIEVLAP